MPRHSKNSSHRSYHTFAERSKGSSINQWGTQRARLGRDSQLPFGYCSLTLTATDDPVASPSGHVYDRQAIYSYMLEKIQEAKLLGVEEPEAATTSQHKHSVAITETNTSASSSASSAGASTDVVVNTESRRRGREEAALHGSTDDKEDGTQEEYNSNSDDIKRARVDSNTMPAPTLDNDDDDDDELPVSESGTGGKNKDKERRLTDTSFWLPQGTPQHIAKAKKAKSARPLSPFSGDPLRRKDLTSVKFQRAAGSTSGNATYLCCVSGEELHHQQAVVLKPSGCVLSLDSFKRAVEPSKPMLCPITSKRLKPKDVLLLARSASGFSSAGEVEAKKYRPSH